MKYITVGKRNSKRAVKELFKDTTKESELYNKFLGEMYKLRSKLRKNALGTDNKTTIIGEINVQQ